MDEKIPIIIRPTTTIEIKRNDDIELEGRELWRRGFPIFLVNGTASAEP
jgi:hypothetical protein